MPVKLCLEVYLHPLGLVIVAGGPGINFALLVQSGFPGLPSEHIHVERSENTGGSNLIVLYVPRFHPQGFRATWNNKIRSVTLTTYLCKWFRFFLMEKKTSNSQRKDFNQEYCWGETTNKQMKNSQFKALCFSEAHYLRRIENQIQNSKYFIPIQIYEQKPTQKMTPVSSLGFLVLSRNLLLFTLFTSFLPRFYFLSHQPHGCVLRKHYVFFF